MVFWLTLLDLSINVRPAPYDGLGNLSKKKVTKLPRELACEVLSRENGVLACPADESTCGHTTPPAQKDRRHHAGDRLDDFPGTGVWLQYLDYCVDEIANLLRRQFPPVQQ